MLAWRRLVTLVAVTLITSACAGAPTPDVVIRNARVFTNDATQPWAEAVAVKGERVVAVGESVALAASAGPSTRVIDAGGRVLVPGFNDARVDLPLEPPTAAALSALDRDAIAHGVTSLQVVAGGPMRTLVSAAQEAQRAARWRLIRSPMDGERPQDEEPFLPPQPGVRLVANGVAWAMSHPFYRTEPRQVPWPGRADVEPGRLQTAVEWAYAAEDPLIVATDAGVTSYLAALSAVGVPDVWRRKRPRVDTRDDPVESKDALGLLSRLGVVVTFIGTPKSETAADGVVWTGSDVEDSSWLLRLRDAGVPVALGSGRGRHVLAAIADGEAWRDRTNDRRRVAIQAATHGSAYAEKTERDKGWLGRGTLADLAILSDDVFTVSPERLRTVRSVLTMVGGAIVYDAGVLPR